MHVHGPVTGDINSLSLVNLDILEIDVTTQLNSLMTTTIQRCAATPASPCRSKVGQQDLFLLSLPHQPVTVALS